MRTLRGVAAFLRLKQNFPRAPLVPGYTPGLSPAHEAGPGHRARAVSTLLGVSRHKQKQAEMGRFEVLFVSSFDVPVSVCALLSLLDVPVSVCALLSLLAFNS